MKVKITLINFLTDTEVTLPGLYDSIEIANNLVNGIVLGNRDTELLYYEEPNWRDLEIVEDGKRGIWTDFVVFPEPDPDPYFGKYCRE